MFQPVQPAAPGPSRPPTAAEWRTEYARLHAAAEEAKQATAVQQQAAAAAQQEIFRLTAELARMRAQATQAPIATARAPTAAAAAAPSTISSTGKASDLDYICRQQLKAIQVPILDGKLDPQLVAEFIHKVELMATNLGMAPHDTTEHSNQTIQVAVGWIAGE